MIVFTEEQKAAFVYDGSYRQAMLEALKTTDAKYLMMTDTKGSSESIKEWKDYVRAHWDYVQLRP